MKFPHIVIYTDKLPDGVGGRANGPIVRIRPRYRYDAGLHAHEYEHVRQWYLTLFAHLLAYRFSRKYRLWSEAKAFARQVEEGARLVDMAHRLAGPHYDLNITVAKARREITKYV